MKPFVAVVLVAGMVAAAPASASAQTTLSVDPLKPCYREQEAVSLLGSGYSPNGSVSFSRDGYQIGDPILADSSGALAVELLLPGLLSGQRHLTYDGTDETNPALFGSTTLLVTATDVTIRPQGGAPDRLLRISARGFTTGDTLFAHVKRIRTGGMRNMRIGPVEGPCGKVSARGRLFSSGAPPGRYNVQFDTFRSYARRAVQTTFVVRVWPPPKPKPEPKPKPKPPPPQPTNCQGYSPCIPPGPDVDCAGGSGNGPRYVDGPVYVSGSDPYDLDRDGDGVACES